MANELGTMMETEKAAPDSPLRRFVPAMKVPQSEQSRFEEQVIRHVSHVTRYAGEWADRLVAEGDRLVDEAQAKRKLILEFADDMRRRAELISTELQAGFESIRNAGRCVTEGRRELFRDNNPRAK